MGFKVLSYCFIVPIFVFMFRVMLLCCGKIRITEFYTCFEILVFFVLFMFLTWWFSCYVVDVLDVVVFMLWLLMFLTWWFSCYGC